MRGFFVRVALAGMLAGASGPAGAAERETVLLRIADVFAMARFCPHLRVDVGSLDAVAKANRIDLDTDKPLDEVFQTLMAGRTAQLWDDDRRETCATAAYRYGPTGIYLKGVMVLN